MIVNTNNGPILARESTHTDLRDHRTVIITTPTMLNVLSISINLRIKINILLVWVACRIDQEKIIIKVLDLSMEAITLIATMQNPCFRQGNHSLAIRTILINLSSNHTSNDSRIKLCLAGNHCRSSMRTQTQTQIRLLARGSFRTKAKRQETIKAETLGIRSEDPSIRPHHLILLKPTMLTAKRTPMRP